MAQREKIAAIDINDYDYELPEDRIAKFPLAQRDASKLLVCAGGQLRHRPFRELAEELAAGSLLLFNDTKVIHARLHFELPNGKPLEILCLEPILPAEHQQSFSAGSGLRWKCLVGGNRRWKTGRIEKSIATEAGPLTLSAARLGRSADAFEIQFEWDRPGLAFGEVLAMAGIIPLPPYLNRENVPADEQRYQTVYAREQGSVAAPTAGLHFTDAVFSDMADKGIERAFVTLHVGAGTFKPVSADRLEGHHMHEESLFVNRETVARLLKQVESGLPIIPVGTTSMRVLESLYWHGQALLSGHAAPHLDVRQWAPYEQSGPLPSAAEALAAVHQQLAAQQQDYLQGITQLLIAPGYTFRLCNRIITNFHQPRSTLLLLIAALIGEDWRRAYAYALAADFRFLSYGDSSLLG